MRVRNFMRCGALAWVMTAGSAAWPAPDEIPWLDALDSRRPKSKPRRRGTDFPQKLHSSDVTPAFRKRTNGIIAAKAVNSRGNSLGDSANAAGSVSHARYCL
jgi:hypothetical protein